MSVSLHVNQTCENKSIKMLIADDMSRFRSIFGENRMRSTSGSYYKWKLFDNPFGKGKLYLERNNKNVVGSTTLTIKRISVFGKPILGAEIGDTFTHPEHRRKGIFSRGVIECTSYAVSNKVELIYGTPNNESLPGYQKKLGYTPCSHVFLSKLKKRTKLFAFLGQAIVDMIKNMHFNNLKIIYTEIRNRIYKRLTIQILFNEEKDFFIFPVDNIPDSIEWMWNTSSYDFFTIRDSTYLNWRYFQNPDHYDVFLAKSDQKYLGYIIIKKSTDGKTGIICDFITVNDRMDVFQALIRRAETTLIKDRVSNIELRCVKGSEYYKILKDNGYLDKGPGQRQQIIVYSNQVTGQKLQSGNYTWHFTYADSDNV